MYIFSERTLKRIAAAIILNLICQIAVPVVAFASTEGSSQKEFVSYESASNSTMVDTFTGQFNYSLPAIDVPGPHGSGYSLSLSYRSGTSPTESASWVGYGWNLSPGAILRNKRGFADDINGEKVTYYNKTDKNVTWTFGLSATTEVFDVEGIGSGKAGIGANTYLRHNNYSGWNISTGLFTSLFGIANLGLNMDSERGGSYSMSLNPLGALAGFAKPGSYGLTFGIPITLTGSLGVSVTPPRPVSMPEYHGDVLSIAPGVQFTAGMPLSGIALGAYGSKTVITTDEARSHPAYGYMYSGNAYKDGEGSMDYFLEKEKPFKTDKNNFLPFPVSTADQFFVSGQGIRGSFRLRHRKPGSFRPGYRSSGIQIHELGVEAILGDTYGGGASYSNGGQIFDVSGFAVPGMSFDESVRENDQDERYFFRMENDMGGSLNYSDNEDFLPISKDGDIPYGSLYKERNKGKRDGRSVHIGYHTIGEMRLGGGNNEKGYRTQYKFKTYNKNHPLTYKSGQDDNIGEFLLTNESGGRYVYGLPVFAKDEQDMAFGVNGKIPVNNHKVYAEYSTDPAKRSNQVIGEERKAMYASTYLLTEVYTPDYIDRSYNGASPDDFGGYTKFNYRQAYGPSFESTQNPDQWYKWRTPYNGLAYSKNSVSTPKDDMGTVSSGYKEIYYLESVETKTHIAYFITNKTNKTTSNGIVLAGTQNERLDGCEALHNDANAANNSGFSVPSKANNLQCLEQIRLYAKNASGEPEKLLKTVHFAYDYSVMPNQPNSKMSGSTRVGKLTLKSVWVESEGVVNAKVSPYQFSYVSVTPPPYTSSLSPFTDQRPTFANPDEWGTSVDSWGAFQKNGAARSNNMTPWVDQTPDDNFDPAAYQLKMISLPSGGTIHIHYEQSDYQYVQDRPAMAMVSIDPSGSNDDVLTEPDKLLGDHTVLTGSENKYYLNIGSTNAYDIKVPGNELIKLRDRIIEQFITNKERIYFKFLYRYGSGSCSPGTFPTGCNQEYVRGYAFVKECGIDNDRLYIRLGSTVPQDMSSASRPIQVAYDFMAAYNRAAEGSGGICGENQPEPDGDPVGTVLSMSKKTDNLSPNNKYNTVNPALRPQLTFCNSYLRIPLTMPKKGGGIRVKRLLMINNDNTLEPGDQAIYGTEYIYKTYDEKWGEISSGVATNEPGIAREENSLVRIVEDSEGPSKVIAGDNILHSEGPLGEYLLPAPSIGYSRVIVKNIHSGKSTPGYMIQDYFTVKDYPSVEVSKSGIDQHIDAPSAVLSLFQIKKATVNAAQGYAFKLKQMHGHIKAVLKCSGDYVSSNTHTIVERQDYDYYKPGEEVPMMYSPDRPLRYELPGKEMEVMAESRSVLDQTRSTPVQFSVAISPKPWFLMLSFFPYLYKSTDRLETNVSTKITSCPVILKSVSSSKDGVKSRTEYLAFDPATGEPVLTHTTDGYNGLNLGAGTNHSGDYYIYNVKAGSQYSALRQLAINDRKVLESKKTYPYISITAVDGGVSADGILAFTYSSVGLPNVLGYEFLKDARGKLTEILQTVTPGDYVEVKGRQDGQTNFKSYGIFQIGKLSVQDLNSATQPMIGFNLIRPLINSSTQIPNQLLDVRMEIFRSAKQNMLDASAGSVSIYGDRQKITAALEFAKKLRDRQRYAEMLNTWIDYGGGSSSLRWDQNITCETYINPIVSLPDHDIVNAQNIIPNTISADRYLFKLAMNNDRTLDIGWWDNNTGNWYQYGGLTFKTKLPYERKERFYVNDYGELAYWTSHTMQTAIRNLDFRFRGYHGPVSSVVPDPVPAQRVNALPDNAHVISASAMTYADTWPYADQEVLNYGDPANSNKFEMGEYGKWRPQAQYEYRTTTIPAVSNTIPTARNYAYAGTLSDFTPFQWDGTPNSAKWKFLSKIVRYSPDGIPLQTEDILGNQTTLKYSHGRNQPAFNAVNTDYSMCDFQSYEDHPQASSEAAHSGLQSLKIPANSAKTCGKVLVNTSLRSRGILASLWLKGVDGIGAQYGTSLTLNGASGNSQELAHIGEWKLFEVIFPPNSVTAGTTLSDAIFSANTLCYVDDFRIQPLDAEMISYVYHPKSLKTIAVLDNRNFGLYYQYDGEGTLIRTIKETAEGMKTVSETIGHLRLIDRPSAGGGASALLLQPEQAGPSNIRRQRNNIAAPATTPSQFGTGKVDIFDLKLSPDQKSIKWFGIDTLRSADKLIRPDSLGIETIRDIKGIKESAVKLQHKVNDSLESARRRYDSTDKTKNK